MLARRRSALTELEQELSGLGVEASGFECDASSPTSIRAALEAVTAKLGAPEVLIYNASLFREGLPSQVPPETVAADLMIDAVGAVASAQSVLPAMRAAGRGTILITGSGVALEPWAPAFTLGIGKAAVRSFALSLAEEVGPYGVHAATVTIDGVITPGTALDPERIAEAFWAVHTQPQGSWSREVKLELPEGPDPANPQV
jgi:NAD(P)-dependent dehydrogenase (short-subunit alcohol dehydrogenase family)